MLPPIDLHPDGVSANGSQNQRPTDARSSWANVPVSGGGLSVGHVFGRRMAGRAPGQRPAHGEIVDEDPGPALEAVAAAAGQDEIAVADLDERGSPSSCAPAARNAVPRTPTLHG